MHVRVSTYVGPHSHHNVAVTRGVYDLAPLVLEEELGRGSISWGGAQFVGRRDGQIGIMGPVKSV